MSQEVEVTKAQQLRDRRARAAGLHESLATAGASVASSKIEILALAEAVWDDNLYRLKYEINETVYPAVSFVGFLERAGVSRSYAYDLKRFVGDPILREFLPAQVSLANAALAFGLRKYLDDNSWRTWLIELSTMSHSEARAAKAAKRAALVESGVKASGAPDVVEVDVSDERCVVAAKIDAILAANDARLVSLFLAYVDKTYAKVSS